MSHGSAQRSTLIHRLNPPFYSSTHASQVVPQAPQGACDTVSLRFLTPRGFLEELIDPVTTRITACPPLSPRSPLHISGHFATSTSTDMRATRAKPQSGIQEFAEWLATMSLAQRYRARLDALFVSCSDEAASPLVTLRQFVEQYSTRHRTC